jgi:hypothetical protein
MPQAPSFEDWDPVGADKNYDTAGFVASCRANRVTPHVAQNDGRGSGSAIDGRTTRWAGYAISQRKRKCIEQVFGWSKTVGRIRQAMYRGRERVEQLFLLTQAAYNLTRMRTLAGRAQEKLQGTDAVGQAAAGGTNLSPIAQPAQEKLQRNPRVEKLSERAAPMAVVPPKPVAEGAPGQRAGVGRQEAVVPARPRPFTELALGEGPTVSVTNDRDNRTAFASRRSRIM